MALSACQCQVESGPLSSPTQTTFGALVAMAWAMASGVEAHWPRQTVLPLLSMTHRWVVCWDTSRPTYCWTVPSFRAELTIDCGQRRCLRAVEPTLRLDAG